MLVFSIMDKLDKCWLVFEAFGVNFPWEKITALPEDELDYLYKKAEEAKKRHEAQVAQQQEMQRAQQQAQMVAMQQQQHFNDNCNPMPLQKRLRVSTESVGSGGVWSS